MSESPVRNLLNFSLPHEGIFVENYAEASINDLTHLHYYCPECLTAWAIRRCALPAKFHKVKVVHCSTHGDGRLFSPSSVPPLHSLPTAALQRELLLWEKAVINV